MPRFFRRLAVGQLDIPDLLARTDQLASFIAEAATAYDRNRSKVVAVGLSNGANIAASLLLRHPSTLRAAGLLRPMLPYEPEQIPELTGTDVLIEAGERDPYSPSEQVTRLTEILRAGGAEVTTTVEPGAGHGLTQDDLRRLAAWVAKLTSV
jgi:predicted esterase